MTQQEKIVALIISTLLGIIGNILWGLYVWLVPCQTCHRQKSLNRLFKSQCENCERGVREIEY